MIQHRDALVVKAWPNLGTDVSTISMSVSSQALGHLPHPVALKKH